RDESTGPLIAVDPPGETGGELWAGMFLHPPATYSQGRGTEYLLVDHRAWTNVRPDFWVSDQIIIRLLVYSDETVRSCDSLPVRRVYDNPLEMVCRWFRP